MAPSTLAGIITAVGVTVTAFGGLIATIGVFLPILRNVKETHKIVNQQHTDIMRFQRALISELRKHGIAIPVDQSIDPGEVEST